VPNVFLRSAYRWGCVFCVYVITNEESQTIDHVVNIIIVDKGMKKRRVAKEITIVVIVAVVVIICVGA